MRRRALLAAALAILAASAPASARADDVSSAELRQLAREASSSPEALERLERVDSVDGAPVDLRRALEGASDAERTRRLRTLAGDGDVAAAPPGPNARAETEAILAESRFHEPTPPRPLRRPLAWLGERLEPIGDAIGTLARSIPTTIWTIIAALAVLVAVLASLRIARRRAAVAVGRDRAARPTTRGLDPHRLEREADEAERRGDFERALRLRFLAGLVFLDRAEAIVLRDSLTTGDVRRRLRSPDFDQIAAAFDAVVYGRRPAGREDVAASKAGWTRVLAAART